MYRSLLVPLDGSDFGEHALPLALSLARGSGRRSRSFTCMCPPGGCTANSAGLTTRRLDRELREQRSRLRRCGRSAPRGRRGHRPEFGPAGRSGRRRDQPARRGHRGRPAGHDHPRARPPGPLLVGQCGRRARPASVHPHLARATQGGGPRPGPGAGGPARADPAGRLGTGRTGPGAGAGPRRRDAGRVHAAPGRPADDAGQLRSPPARR